MFFNVAISTRNVDFPTLKLLGFGLALGERKSFNFSIMEISCANSRRAGGSLPQPQNQKKKKKKKREREREREDLDRAQHNGSTVEKRERERERLGEEKKYTNA